MVRDRELRAAAGFCAILCTAALGTALAPLWLLAFGPLVWGTPHLVAEIRYLVVRPGLYRRRWVCLCGGVPLAMIAAGADLVWGFLGAGLLTLVSRRGPALKAIVVVALGLAAASLHVLGSVGDVIFGHVHNLVAVLFWWGWRQRSRALHWAPLLMLVLVTGLCFLPASRDALVSSSLILSGISGFVQGPEGLGWSTQLHRLAPGLDTGLATSLVLSFCLLQSVHYAIWFHLVPDQDRTRKTPISFRATWRELVTDLGGVGVAVTIAFALGIVAWALMDLHAAHEGYFRVARFHGHLELMAGVHFVLEGRPSVRV